MTNNTFSCLWWQMAQPFKQAPSLQSGPLFVSVSLLFATCSWLSLCHNKMGGLALCFTSGKQNWHPKGLTSPKQQVWKSDRCYSNKNTLLVTKGERMKRIVKRHFPAHHKHVFLTSGGKGKFCSTQSNVPVRGKQTQILIDNNKKVASGSG